MAWYISVTKRYETGRARTAVVVITSDIILFCMRLNPIKDILKSSVVVLLGSVVPYMSNNIEK